MISLDTKPVASLTANELSRCRRLTFKAGGSMHRQLDTERAQDNSLAVAIIARDSNGTIYGWALAYRDEAEPTFQYDVYFFVDPEFRRCGIASMLVEKVLSLYHMPRFHPHDFTSACFFVKFEGSFKAFNTDKTRLDKAREVMTA